MATIKQKKALKKIAENSRTGGTLGQALVEAGYSEEVAKTPTKVTKSKGFQELVDRYISDDDLLQVLKEGLRATKLSGTGGMRLSVKADGSVDEFGHSDLETPDYAVRHKYMETGYKLKGHLGGEKEPGGNTTNNFIFFDDERAKTIAGRIVRRISTDNTGESESLS